jgi:EmrB/QacA subfamily drug resistance transporter
MFTPPVSSRSLLLTMCAALVLVIGANSSLTIALPDLAEDLGATQTQLTWIVNAYALTFAAALLAAGVAADRFGRRRSIVTGLLIFGLSSLASAFGESSGVVIALRLVAGLGAAAVFPVTLSALVDGFPPDRRAFAVSVWAGVSGAGALVGTVAAGLLLEAAWWGSVQLVYGVGALALIPFAARTVADRRTPGLNLDPVGGTLAAVGFGALVFGVIEGPERGWTTTPTLAAVTVGVAALVAFVLHELRTTDPLLDVRLYRSKGLTAGSILIALQFFAAFGFFVLAPQYLQFVQGDTALVAALSLLPLGLGIGPVSAFAPALILKLGARWVGTAGMALLAVAFLGLAQVQDGTPFWAWASLLVVFGVGFGLAATPGTTLIVDGLPPERRSVASAVNDVTREVGGALGGAALASALIAVYQDDLEGALRGVPPEAAEPAREGIAGAFAAAERLGPDGARLAEAATQAFTTGFSAAMLVGAAVLLAGAVLTAWLAPPEAGRDGLTFDGVTAEPAEPVPA